MVYIIAVVSAIAMEGVMKAHFVILESADVIVDIIPLTDHAGAIGMIMKKGEILYGLVKKFKGGNILPPPTHTYLISDFANTKNYFRDNDTRRSPNFKPFVQCDDNTTCQTIDINLVCSSESRKCECRKDMKWNE